MKNRQMSDSLLIASLITFSGGLQDAYTYFARDHVFANAQTGNMVLMGAHLLDGNIPATMRYLLPVICFAAGVFVAEQIQANLKENRTVHWRQIILIIEIIALTCSAFVPVSMNILANSLISFSCAMQVQAFRSANGYPYASTMCIGNLRSAVDSFSKWVRTKEKGAFTRCMHYLLVIFVFTVGATAGYGLIPVLGLHTILVSSGFLLVAAAFMIIDKA